MKPEHNRVDVYSVTGTGEEDGSTSMVQPLLGQLAVILRERVWFVSTATVLALVVLFVAYPRGVTFTSSAIFMSEAPRSASPVSSIAAQIGISTAVQGSTTSPQFYLELIRTPRFLQSVVDTRVPSIVPGDTATRSVAELLGFPGDSRIAQADAAKALSYSLSAAPMGNTGMVRVAVSASSPQLATTVTEVLLQRLHEFNLRTRQSRATAERQFVERRVGEVSAQLRDVEDRLQRFLAENRDFSRAPALQFDYGRLQREVALRQSLFTSLTQSYEQARIDEVRDTPVITVVSPPEEPLTRDPLGRVRLLAFTLLFALGAGWAAANIRDQLRSDKGVDGSEKMEIVRLAREFREDLRHGRLRQVVLGRPRAVVPSSENGNPHSAESRDAAI